MAKTASTFKWQWPAGRSPDFKMVVKIISAKQPSKLFPSFFDMDSNADYLKDALTVQAEVVHGPHELEGRQIDVKVPRAEAQDVREGGLAGMGVIRSDQHYDNICICLRGMPAEIPSDRYDTWLQDMPCGS